MQEMICWYSAQNKKTFWTYKLKIAFLKCVNVRDWISYFKQKCRKTMQFSLNTLIIVELSSYLLQLNNTFFRFRCFKRKHLLLQMFRDLNTSSRVTKTYTKCFVTLMEPSLLYIRTYWVYFTQDLNNIRT
jgi:hypothetical protein